MTKNKFNTPPHHIGPYRIIDILGRGGMGVVYRAEHEETGDIVALKTIQVPNPQRSASIRREIRALARINHPGVVHIIDEGIKDDIPWYAMEFLEGVTLRQYGAEFVWGGSDISTAWTSDENNASAFSHIKNIVIPSNWRAKVSDAIVDADTIEDLTTLEKTEYIQPAPESISGRVPAAGGSLPAVLAFICRVCHTLAFLHGEGIIHGDLKPSNIMVVANGMPVIMDFGLVTQIRGDISREQFETDRIAGGTLYYVAPEQIRSELVDARTDLYSLGCMLYGLVTGRMPFEGQTTSQIINAQLDMDPAPPSELAEGVPPELNRLILQLLAKKPQDRIGYADNVAAILIKLGVDEDILDSYPKPRAYLYRSRFAGRKDEMCVLEEHLDRLASGKGNLVLIGGESGIGKTRFLMELNRITRYQKIKVLLGECIQISSLQGNADSEMNVPLQALKQPLRKIAEYCRGKGRAETDRVFGSRGKILAMFEPKLAQLPGQDAYPAPTILPSDAARLRLYTNLSETFAALASNQPFMMVLDDLQWADDLTMGFLGFLLRIGQLENIPLLIVGTYRTEELNEILRRVINAPKSICMELGRLDEKAIGDIVTDMLAVSEPPSVFVPFLTRFSEGNPFFIAEYLRTAILEGVLYRDWQGFWQVAEESDKMASEEDYRSLPLPKALMELVERRLRVLSEHAMEIVSATSVIGREIPVLLLWNIIPFNDEMLDSLDELIKRQVLDEVQPGQLRFMHDKIREVVYEGLSQKQRVELHRASALAIEALYGKEEEEHYASLSQHWEQAGDVAKAQKYHLANARQSVSQYALLEAEQAYRAYLNLLDQPTAEMIAIRNEYSKKALYNQGRFKEAQNEYMISLEEARNINEKVLEGQCLLGLAKTNEVIGNVKKASELCRKSLEIFSNTGNLEYEADALSCLGSICFNRGSLDEAKTLYHKSIDIHSKLDSQPLKGSNLEQLALVYWNQGNMKKAQMLFKQALEIFRNTKNKHALGICLGNFANIYSFQGDYHKARDLYEQSLAIIKEIGDRHTEGIFLCNLGTVYSYQGNLDLAQQFYEKALKIHRDIFDRRMEGVTLGNLGTTFQVKGLPKKAYKLYQSALSIHQELNDRQHEGTTLYNLGQLKCIVDGDFDASEKMIENAISIFKTIGDQFFVGMCLSQLGHIALARGFSSSKYFEEIQSIIDKIKASPNSELSKAFQKLKYSEETFKSGGRLFHGERIEDLSEGLRNWLIKTGLLVRDNDINKNK